MAVQWTAAGEASGNEGHAQPVDAIAPTRGTGWWVAGWYVGKDEKIWAGQRLARTRIGVVRDVLRRRCNGRRRAKHPGMKAMRNQWGLPGRYRPYKRDGAGWWVAGWNVGKDGKIWAGQ
jgi:hypothetical protein